MKVLLLTREFPPHVYGGAGVVVRELSKALRRLAAVEVRCFGGQREDGEGWLVRGYAPWERLREGPPERFLGAVEALSANLAMARDPTDADVVHAHTWYADLAGVLVQKLHGIPLVVTLHSLEPLRPWKAEQLGSGYALSSWVEKTAVEAADRVIAVSEGMRRDILRHFAVPEERIALVHNGVDPALFRRTEGRGTLAALGVRPPYILYVGRVTRQKGLPVLVEASRLLPDGAQVVLCAGNPDTPEVLEELRRSVAGNPRVRLIEEWLAPERIVELYSHAAAFACPSLYEPFGIINLEAMACAVPVVGSDVGGIREVVVPGETGLLVPAGDAPSLAGALGRVLRDPALARRMGEAGRRRVETHFTWDRVAERTLQVYREAARAGR